MSNNLLSIFTMGRDVVLLMVDPPLVFLVCLIYSFGWVDYLLVLHVCSTETLSMSIDA